MTPDQVALVRATWQQVLPIGDTAAQLFYERLFQLEPEVRRLFAHTDMKQQRQQLLHVLGAVVATADRLHGMGPKLQELGRRHVGYGVEERHYEVVGRALLATLEQGLGSAFTEQAREAWKVTYTTVASHMISGAREESQAA